MHLYLKGRVARLSFRGSYKNYSSFVIWRIWCISSGFALLLHCAKSAAGTLGIHAEF